MSRASLPLVIAALVISLVLPADAPAGVAIHLKNGMTMTADSCEESGGTLTCYKMGGAFLLNRSDVEKLSERKTAVEDEPAAAEAAPGAAPDKVEPAKDDDQKKELTPEEQFNQIRQRKMELQDEGKKLAQDREKLREDVKQSPDWMTTDQFEALSKRNKEMDERLKKYNEEVKRLNEEETKIIGTQPQQQKRE